MTVSNSDIDAWLRQEQLKTDQSPKQVQEVKNILWICKTSHEDAKSMLMLNLNRPELRSGLGERKTRREEKI